MSKNSFTVTLTESALSNGAEFCKVLYAAGADVTTRAIARTFSQNIPFSKAARVVRSLANQPRDIILAQLTIESRAAGIWSATYDQTVERTGDKVQAKALADSAEASFRLSANNGDEYDESNDDSDAVPVTRLPGNSKSGVKPFGKPSDAHNPQQPKGLELDMQFKIEDSRFTVKKKLTTGELRIFRNQGATKPHVGTTFKANGCTYRVSKEIGIDSFNAVLVPMEESAPAKKPVKVESPKPATAESRIDAMESMLGKIAQALNITAE